jgi:hypothetical protein
VERISVFTASRSLILLAASGATLLVGLLLIYYPALRRPSLLFVGGLALLAIGLLVPAPALLAAQAASLGLLLAACARVLEWMVLRRRFRRSTIRGQSYPDADSQSQAISLSRLDAAPQATTVRAVRPVVSPATESES